MIYAAGIDVGSTQTKGIILNDKFEIVARALTDTGAYVTRAAERCFVEALQASGVKREDVAYVVGTGYGRYKVTFGDAQITEISCHARGASYLFPNTRTVIDMGGQDAKGIKIGVDGDVKDFVMNDKCAAGTGRFLGSAADALAHSPGRYRRYLAQGEKPGAPHHRVHGVRRVGHHVLSRPGQEDRRHPRRRAQRHRRADHLFDSSRRHRAGSDFYRRGVKKHRHGARPRRKTRHETQRQSGFPFRRRPGREPSSPWSAQRRRSAKSNRQQEARRGLVPNAYCLI